MHTSWLIKLTHSVVWWGSWTMCGGSVATLWVWVQEDQAGLILHWCRWRVRENSAMATVLQPVWWCTRAFCVKKLHGGLSVSIKKPIHTNLYYSTVWHTQSTLNYTTPNKSLFIRITSALPQHLSVLMQSDSNLMNTNGNSAQLIRTRNILIRTKAN